MDASSRKSRTSFNRRQALSSLAAVAVSTAGTTASGEASQPKVKAHDTLIGRFRSGESCYKTRAKADYAANMNQFGGSLSSLTPPDLVPGSTQPWQYDILVVGSGYGASISAARLAQSMRPGTRMALLERGAEWIPGTYPDTIGSVAEQSRFKPLGLNRRSQLNPIGLYDVRQTNELMIVAGSGLGGCSLVNANVALRPDREVFLQSQWPIALQDRDVLEPYYERAAWELGTQFDPLDHMPKMKAQRIAAERLQDIGCHFEAAALTITRNFADPALPILNRQGMLQRNCIDCGDCMTGCNVGAKNTLAMNYLPIARRHGAMLFSQCEVQRLHRRDGYYVIEYLHHSQGPAGDICTTRRFTSARLVVLGAGSLGTCEILLRSQCSGLEFSPALGCNWTANGDAIGFVDNSQLCTRSGGTSAYHSDRRSGPTIQSNITYPHRTNLHDRVLIQDGAIARTYANIISGLFLDAKLENTLVMLGMGHDGQHGRVVLHEDGNADVLWPGLLKSAYREKIRREFAIIAQAHGGKYRHLNPPHDRMITVHPLGGCGMSDDPRAGVIDHRGRVYDFSGGGDVCNAGEFSMHEGLYVCDGAMYPTAIAVNPFFTIAAMAERNAMLMKLNPQYADLFEPLS